MSRPPSVLDRIDAERLRFVANTVPALLAYLDAGVHYVWANETYRRWFGRSPESMSGLHAREIVGEPAWLAVRHHVERALAGEEVSYEARIDFPGHTRDVQVNYVPDRDADGCVRGFVTLVTDVSAMRSTERELENERARALAELREADQRKDEFLAMLSHELRNPMAPILTAVEILRLAPDDAETSATARAVIERQVAHMKQLLDDLLDVSRVSQGKIALRREVLELDSVLQRAIEVSQPLMTERDQRLSVTSAGGAILVDADAARLVQVFGNLLNNASKYSDRGGAIEVQTAVEDREVVVRVRDHGVGMTPDLLERAFDLFVQDTRSLDRAQGGIGVGLTLVRALVKRHDGSVRAFSGGPGRGSEIVVRLPLAVAPATG